MKLVRHYLPTATKITAARWRPRKRQGLLLVLLALILTLIVVWESHLSLPRAFTSSTTTFAPLATRRDPEAPSLVVHLDLKGSPPTIPFLEQFLRLIAAEGADGLLVEYEDMFPYEGSLANLSAPNAYTKKEVHQILVRAAELGLQVIPLVQTFGHMEFVLKLPEFKHLSENYLSSNSLCPLHPESMALLQEMLLQVMRLHLSGPAPVRFVHIGSDEVYDLGVCPRCALSGLSKNELFLDHVVKVAHLVKDFFPAVTPLIWDDMMRSFSFLNLAERLKLGNLVEPVVWYYNELISQPVPPTVWL